MMVDDNELCSENIPNPSIRSLNKTLIEKVVGGNLVPDNFIYDVRKKGEVVIEVPKKNERGAIKQRRAFRIACPLVSDVNAKDTGGKKRRKTFWTDIINNEKKIGEESRKQAETGGGANEEEEEQNGK